MTYDLVKFERGQVWMIRHKHPSNAVGHEQQKDRPWLVLSVGKFNKSSGMITAVPITTRDKITTPAQVMFNNDRGYNNVILCEQVKSFDYKSGAYIFDFIGNLSSEILEKVDVAVSIHLGLHYSPITLKKLYDSMEAIIKSVGYMEEKVNTPKFTDDDVLQFAEKLQMLAASDVESDTVIENKINNYNAPIREDNTKFDAWGVPIEEETESQSNENVTMEHRVEVDNSKEKTQSVETKQKRIKWTPEKCEEFLHDADTLPMKKVMDKWNILKKARFYSMKNYAATLLKKTK